MIERTPDPFSIPAKKSLGQHFLTSPIVPSWMCDAAFLEKGQSVLEIGPGTGVLTEELLKRGMNVYALETDKRSITTLQERFSVACTRGQLQIIEGDVRQGIPEHSWLTDHDYQIVANIPYYLTGLILRTYLESQRQPRRMTLLVQKEVAERIARSKRGSLLQVAVQAFGTPKYVRTVSPGHFSPPPRIDSAILDISDITHQNLPIEQREDFFYTLRAGFAHKRKQVANNLQTAYPNRDIGALLSQLHLNPRIRAEEIDWCTWIKLATLLQKNNKQQ